MSDDPIIITTFPLKNKWSKVKELLKDDERLHKALENTLEEVDDSIEIFRTEKNIAVTEEGYVGAFYESSLEKVEPHE